MSPIFDKTDLKNLTDRGCISELADGYVEIARGWLTAGSPEADELQSHSKFDPTLIEMPTDLYSSAALRFCGLARDKADTIRRMWELEKAAYNLDDFVTFVRVAIEHSAEICIVDRSDDEESLAVLGVDKKWIKAIIGNELDFHSKTPAYWVMVLITTRHRELVTARAASRARGARLREDSGVAAIIARKEDRIIDNAGALAAIIEGEYILKKEEEEMRLYGERSDDDDDDDDVDSDSDSQERLLSVLQAANEAMDYAAMEYAAIY